MLVQSLDEQEGQEGHPVYKPCQIINVVAFYTINVASMPKVEELPKLSYHWIINYPAMGKHIFHKYLKPLHEYSMKIKKS